jgi:dimethylargininase
MLIDVDDEEPYGANALLVRPRGTSSDDGGTVLCPAAFPKTRARLERYRIRVRPVDVDELAKAEGGVTCCSLLVDVGR